MKKFGTKWICPLLLLFTACGTDEDITSADDDRRQSFSVVVESVGELFSGGEGVTLRTASRRPISSVAPTQTFDKMAVLIMEYAEKATVVYKKTIEDWSNPNNKASIPWSTENGMGRYATITLTGDECMDEGKTYLAYAIGYNTGSYGNYEPFKDVKVGDNYNRTEVVTVPDGEMADEIFAGAEMFYVENGKVMSTQSEKLGREQGIMFVRRQVAGTFGYFTNIPVEVSGEKVAKLRLVATKRNKTVIFGGFRSVDDPLYFHQNNVVNGMNPNTDYNCRLEGSARNDAFIVYEIELCKWFPGNTDNALLPFDKNDDGYLDGMDDNWHTDEDTYPKGTISLAKGSVFADCFLVAVAMTREDVNNGTHTFQMQLTDADGNVLKAWNVSLRDFEQNAENRTMVSLPNGVNGRTEISQMENVDTEYCFSIVRNRLYTLGEKSQAQNYGEDEPVDLARAKDLVLDARHEWQIHNLVIFN